MTTFASTTTVPVERTRAEIESILTRYGASHFGYMTTPAMGSVGFEVSNRRVRFDLSVPDREKFRTFRRKGTYSDTRRTDDQVRQLWEQECRSRWRALLLAIKAKLEAVECGIATFEEEFLAHIVLPSGDTVGELIGPQLARTYESGRMPPLLEGPEP